MRPYLEATLTLTVPPTAPPDSSAASPLFTVFYIHSPVASHSEISTDGSDVIVTPPCPQFLPVIADSATKDAETIFWRAVEKLRAAGVRRTLPTEGELKREGEAEEELEKGAEETSEVDAFWPPLDAVDDEASGSDDW